MPAVSFIFPKYVLFLLIILSLFIKQATKQFLEEINKWTVQYNVSPLSWNVAVKFLMARKFDVLRAVELFHSYRVRRWSVAVELSIAVLSDLLTHAEF